MVNSWCAADFGFTGGASFRVIDCWNHHLSFSKGVPLGLTPPWQRAQSQAPEAIPYGGSIPYFVQRSRTFSWSTGLTLLIL